MKHMMFALTVVIVKRNMERETKFRVWKPVAKSLMLLEDEFVSEAIYRSKNEEHILMQYTGLKDKNGKEIYEGDVVKCFKGNPHNWDETKKEHIFVVKIPKIYEMSIVEDGGDSYNDHEIIGDVYSTPDILK